MQRLWKYVNWLPTRCWLRIRSVSRLPLNAGMSRQCHVAALLMHISVTVFSIACIFDLCIAPAFSAHFIFHIISIENYWKHFKWPQLPYTEIYFMLIAPAHWDQLRACSVCSVSCCCCCCSDLVVALIARKLLDLNYMRRTNSSTNTCPMGPKGQCGNRGRRHALWQCANTYQLQAASAHMWPWFIKMNAILILTKCKSKQEENFKLSSKCKYPN